MFGTCSSVLSQAVELVSITVLRTAQHGLGFTVETVGGKEVSQGTGLPEAFTGKGKWN